MCAAHLACLFALLIDAVQVTYTNGIDDNARTAVEYSVRAFLPSEARHSLPHKSCKSSLA